jgi:hypothetical protein
MLFREVKCGVSRDLFSIKYGQNLLDFKVKIRKIRPAQHVKHVALINGIWLHILLRMKPSLGLSNACFRSFWTHLAYN